MSMYVAPASNAPWKIPGTKRGSAAFEDRVAPVCGGDRSDIGRIGGIDLRGHEPAVRPETVDDAPGARLIDIGEHDTLVEVPARGDRRERSPDTSRPDDQDPHGGGV